VKRINVCSLLGNPIDPLTWSGTPFNLCHELEKINYLADTFSSRAIPNKVEGKLLKWERKYYYKNSRDTERGFLTRYLNSKRVKKLTKNSSSNLTLHTGTLDLPFLISPQKQKHYLYCDSTWNLWSSCSDQKQEDTSRLYKDAERLEKKSYDQMKHIFTISEYVKDNLINHYHVNPQKITVVGTGLGVIKPYFGLKDYTNGKILFVAKGRFEDKGGHLVLKAFEMASKINSNLKLIIIGQDEYKEKIKGNNIKVYGFLPIDDLQNIFNECSLFLMPAIREPWGLVYLEALACKMPIIGINRNSFPEISQNGKYGFGLDDENPEKLCRLLINVLSDYNNLEKMGKEGQAFCLEKFSWSKTVSKIISTI